MLPEGLTAAAIRPMPRTAPAAEACVPTSWSSGIREVPTRDTAAPPTRPIPMRSIPTVSKILRMAATVYGRRGVRHLIGERRTYRLGRVPEPQGPMAKEVHITPEGLVAVQKEHHDLTTVNRPAIVAKIKAARELGDLSENFEYHAAKNEQGMMEARVKELEAIVKNHVLIEAKKATGVIDMGSTVRFSEAGQDEETYRIVGPAEADPKAGRVSYESALGKAMIGHRVGDEVEIKTPNSSYRVRIVGVD